MRALVQQHNVGPHRPVRTAPRHGRPAEIRQGLWPSCPCHPNRRTPHNWNSFRPPSMDLRKTTASSPCATRPLRPHGSPCPVGTGRRRTGRRGRQCWCRVPRRTFSSPAAIVRWKRHLQAVRQILKACSSPSTPISKAAAKPANSSNRPPGTNNAPMTSTNSSPPRQRTPTHHTQRNGSSPLLRQLTHDYLVPSIREWLTRKQKETATGRAEIKLADRTALHTSRREQRYRPASGTGSKSRTHSPQTLDTRRSRRHARRHTAAHSSGLRRGHSPADRRTAAAVPLLSPKHSKDSPGRFKPPILLDSTAAAAG
jgi:hypothetical protein